MSSAFIRRKMSVSCLNEPRSYEEAQEIADHLRSRSAVVVNLQRVRTDQASSYCRFPKRNGICFEWEHFEAWRKYFSLHAGYS